MKIKTTKEKRILIIKTSIRWILYFVIIFICFSFMMAGTLKKPVLLIPVAICIAMNTGELQSAFTGAFCGLLIDVACGRIFGYNALFLTIICTFTSLMFLNYFRKKFMNFFVIATVSAFISGFLDYKFYYNIWNYENTEIILKTVILPVCAYTVISAVPIYLLFSLVNKFFMPKRHLSIEEVIKINQEENL